MNDSPHRRLEDRSIFRYFYDLLRGQTIRGEIRSLSSGLVVGFVWFGRGPLFRPDSRAYQNPVFDGIFTLAPPQAWGAGFWTCAALVLIAVLTGRALVFFTGILLSTGILLAWCVGVIAQAIKSEEAVLTDGAIGLYVLAFTAIVGLVGAKEPLERQVEIYERTADGDVIPLKQVDRRAM